MDRKAPFIIKIVYISDLLKELYHKLKKISPIFGVFYLELTNGILDFDAISDITNRLDSVNVISSTFDTIHELVDGYSEKEHKRYDSFNCPMIRSSSFGGVGGYGGVAG